MKSQHKFKIIGVFVLAIALTVTLAACDMGDDTDPEPTMHELIVEMEGEGIILDEDGEELLTEEDESETIDAEDNTSVTLEAGPEDGWEFIEWTGAKESEQEEISVLMDGDKEVTAHFEPLEEEDVPGADITEVEEVKAGDEDVTATVEFKNINSVYLEVEDADEESLSEAAVEVNESGDTETVELTEEVADEYIDVVVYESDALTEELDRETMSVPAEGDALLSIQDFSDEFPDEDAGHDYDDVTITVEELQNQEPDEEVVDLKIVGDEEGKIFNETIDDQDIPADGSEDFVFTVDGTITDADNYTATVTADAENANKIIETEDFTVEAGDADRDESNIEPADELEIAMNETDEIVVSLYDEYENAVPIDDDNGDEVTIGMATGADNLDDEDAINNVEYDYDHGDANEVEIEVEAADDAHGVIEGVHITSNIDGDEIDITVDYTVKILEVEANFKITIDKTNSPVTEGEDLEVDVTVENTGGEADTQDINLLDFDGNKVDSQEVEDLEAADSEEIKLVWETEENDSDTDEIIVESEDESVTEEVTIEEESFPAADITEVEAVEAGDEDVTATVEFENIDSVYLEVEDADEESLSEVAVEVSESGDTKTVELTEEVADEYIDVVVYESDVLAEELDRETVRVPADVDEDIVGSGTAEDPYVIYTFTGLEKIHEEEYSLSAYYELGSNIDASPTEDRFYNDGEGWEPIGNEDEAFSGYFDGRGYKIRELYIDRLEQENIGLFGIVEKGNINKINLEDFEIVGDSNVGGLVGFNYDNVIEDNYVSGEIENTATSGNTGGLIGVSENAVIKNCHTETEIIGSGRDIGGLIGKVFGDDHKIEQSSATGDVYSSEHGERVGGLIGSSSGIRSTIEASHALGDVHGTGEDLGGLIGENKQTFIKDNYATGNVKISGLDSLADGLGGLIGRNEEADIEDSHAEGDALGDRDNSRRVGGLVGYNIDGDIINSYAEGKIEGRQNGGGLVGINAGGELIEVYALGDVEVNGNGGGGLIGRNSDGDIIDSYSEGKVESSRFTGGLIGRNYDSEILDSHSTSNVYGGDSVGGLIGYNSGTFEEIKNSYAEGEVIGRDSDVGGLVGENENINIINSYALGDVIGDRDNSSRVGGLIGDNEKGNISNSYAEGNIENARQSGGGLVGRTSGGDISETYALGEVTVYGNSGGGLIGDKVSGDLIDSYYKGSVEANRFAGGLVGRNDEVVEYSYSVAEVNSEEEIGGLIASNDGEVTSSYWNKTIGPEISEGGQGKTTSEMQSKNTFEDWDFDDIWTIQEEDSYPYFQWQEDNIPTPDDEEVEANLEVTLADIPDEIPKGYEIDGAEIQVEEEASVETENLSVEMELIDEGGEVIESDSLDFEEELEGETEIFFLFEGEDGFKLDDLGEFTLEATADADNADEVTASEDFEVVQKEATEVFAEDIEYVVDEDEAVDITVSHDEDPFAAVDVIIVDEEKDEEEIYEDDILEILTEDDPGGEETIFDDEVNHDSGTTYDVFAIVDLVEEPKEPVDLTEIAQATDDYKVVVEDPPSKAVLDISYFAHQLPDKEEGHDYGSIEIEILEEAGVQTENLTAEFIIEGENTGEVFSEKKTDLPDIQDEGLTIDFDVGSIDQADEYVATAIAYADNAESNTGESEAKREEDFTVESKSSAFFEVDIIDYPEKVDAGEEIVVDVQVTNTGEKEEWAFIDLFVDEFEEGEYVDDEEIELKPGQNTEVELKYETSSEDAPEVEIIVKSLNQDTDEYEGSDSRVVEVKDKELEIDAKILEFNTSTTENFIGLSVTFENTGGKEHTFIAGASLWEPGSDINSESSYEDFAEEITLNPGETETAGWYYAPDMYGEWAYQFAIWEEDPAKVEDPLCRDPSPVKFIEFEDSEETGLIIESLEPSEIETEQSPYDAELSVSGNNFENVEKIEFAWYGAVENETTWEKFDEDWVEKVTVHSDTSMTLEPRVVEPAPTWSGTATWEVTLVDVEGNTATDSFEVTYTDDTDTGETIDDVPYIHQINDTEYEVYSSRYDRNFIFYGAHACGATSAVMITAYHERLGDDYTELGKYVNQEYTNNAGEKLDWILQHYNPDYQHESIHTNYRDRMVGAGAWGYIHRPDSNEKYLETDYSGANRDRVISFFEKHGLQANEDWTAGKSDVINEIDSGRPVYASTGLTDQGHIVVIVGYTDYGKLIIHDPGETSNMVKSWEELGTRYIITVQP